MEQSQEFVVTHRDRDGEIIERRVVQAVNERQVRMDNERQARMSHGGTVQVEVSVEGIELSVQDFLRRNPQMAARAKKEKGQWVLLRVRPNRHLGEKGVKHGPGDFFFSAPERYRDLRDLVDLIPLPASKIAAI